MPDRHPPVAAAPSAARSSAFATATLAIFAALLWPTTPVAGAATAKDVKFDLAQGRVGGLELGVATRSQVIGRFGTPRRQYDDVPGADAGTRRLIYSCGTGCTLETQIDAANTLVLVWAHNKQGATQRRMRTRAGTYLGISKRSAERREDKLMQPGCVTQLTKRRGNFYMDVGATAGSRVDSIILAISGASVLC